MRSGESFAVSWRHFDFWLLGAVALLVIFGVTMIRSAVAGNIELVALNLVQRQIIFALAGRLAANYQLAGGLGTVLANITNASFLAPIAYMLVKFSNVRLERLPLWLREDAPWVAVARHAYQFTHSLLS